MPFSDLGLSPHALPALQQALREFGPAGEVKLRAIANATVTAIARVRLMYVLQAVLFVLAPNPAPRRCSGRP